MPDAALHSSSILFVMDACMHELPYYYLYVPSM